MESDEVVVSSTDVVPQATELIQVEAEVSSSASQGREMSCSEDNERKSNGGTSSSSPSPSSSTDVKKDIVFSFAQPSLPPPLGTSSLKSKSRPAPAPGSGSSPSSGSGSGSERRQRSSESTDAEVDSDTDTRPSSSSSPSPSAVTREKQRLSKEKQEKYNAILSALKYHPPKYAAPGADPKYNLEVLKNGSIVDSLTFSGEEDQIKHYYIIGRVPGCDIVAENPTVSRLHAILQFVKAPPPKQSTEDKEDEEDAGLNPKETGLYLYDLKSTHGTFINKNQVFPQRFYRVHVGHVLKFGSSQRMYIVNGPMDDEEEESEKSVTQLQNEKLQKDLERKRQEEEDQLKKGLVSGSGSGSGSKLPAGNIEEEGINWGMAEDADEGTDMKINPFAMDYESSELTLDNPKKTLRSWFDREGYDLEFEMREKGNGQYVCRIPLPLDGPTDAPVYAESEVKGKKKEAAHDAAMKACQILDSHGILRASNQESRKRKEKHYDEDYYSSDEDSFLDRTGTAEKKREKRMRLSGKVEEKVDTYDTLSKKYNELEEEVQGLQSKISKSQEMKTRADEGDVDIDDYMNMLKSGVLDVKKLKSKLKEAKEEMQRTKKLMDIAKPAELPSYLQKKAETGPTPSQSASNPPNPVPEATTVKEEEEDINGQTKIPPESSSGPGEGASTAKKPLVGPRKPPVPPAAAPEPRRKLYGLIKPSDISSLKTSLRPEDQERPVLKDELENDNEEEMEEDSSSSDVDGEEGNEGKEAETSSSSPVPKKKKRQRYRNQYKKKENATQSYDHDDPKYSTWLPPKNQTGDGRTSLNEKLGY